MFKLHKPQLSGSIHSGHFMVSRLDDDEDNIDPADDSSESERDNAQSVEIDIHNPDSVADAPKNLEISYPSNKNEQVTSWNDLDRPSKRLQKQNQYLTYYTNSSSTYTPSTATSSNVTGNSDQLIDARLISSANSLAQASSSTSPATSASIMAPTNLVVNQSSQGRTQSLFSLNTCSASLSLDAQACGSALHQSSATAAAILNEASRHLQNRQKLQQQQQQHSQQLNNYSVINRNPDRQSQLTKQQQQQQMQSANSSATAHGAGQHAHQVTIDTSLTKLLQCMSLYYSSSLTSPKWKSFKGLKLRLKYKIRLNNLIWRAWFLQYIRGRRPPGCQFVAPVETDVHKKTETILLEGKYWKRKEKAIADEYKKWRIFNIHKQKNQLHCFRPSSFDWDSRASNLASSGTEYHFYPDYDMSIPYNLDEMPMLEELEQQQNQASQETYYQMQPSQTPQQQQQQQHQQMELIINPSTHQQSTGYVPQHHQLPPASHSQQHSASDDRSLQHSTPISAFNIDNNAIYQQIQQQNQQQLSLDHDMQMSSGESSTSGRHEQRRVCHINAEQKRRCNIKNGFDTLRSILPTVNQNVNFKISKASMLQKAAVHITNLSSEQKQQAEERASLKQQIESLKQTISNYQSQLPASGSSSNYQSTANDGTERAREMLQEYIRQRTLENWKFWIFSLLVEPLFQTYYQTVNTNSLEDACKTIVAWLDQSCGLVSLRKDALESLTFLSTSTNILQTPHTLSTEAVDAVRYSAATRDNQRQNRQPQPTPPSTPQSRQVQVTSNIHQTSTVANNNINSNNIINGSVGSSNTMMASPMHLSRQSSIFQMPQASHLHLQQHQQQQQLLHQQQQQQQVQIQSSQSFQALPLTTAAQQPQSTVAVLQHAQQQQQQQQQQHQLQQQQVMNVPPNAMHTHTIRTLW